jgi:uncharacterized protein (DUF58 family)
LYIIAELSLATLLISIIAPYFNILGISSTIKHAKYFNQNETITIKIDLDTYSFFNKYFLELWIKTPFSQKQNHMFFITKLAGKQTIETKIVCDIRGVHQVGPLLIQTGFPLGLKIFKKVLQNQETQVVVLPNYVDIKKNILSTNEGSNLYGNSNSTKKGGYNEFISIREYKPGDSPRHIHWPGSAKKGKLLVKEYQDNLFSNMVVILDLNKDYDVGSGKHTTLEYAITISLSMIIYALSNGYSVSLFGFGKEYIEFLDISNVGESSQITKALAYVKSNGEKNYKDVIKHALKKSKMGATVVLFDNGKGAILKNIQTYTSQHFKPILFDIDAKSFKQESLNSAFKQENKHSYMHYKLEKGCDIQRMFS